MEPNINLLKGEEKDLVEAVEETLVEILVNAGVMKTKNAEKYLKDWSGQFTKEVAKAFVEAGILKYVDQGLQKCVTFVDPSEKLVEGFIAQVKARMITNATTKAVTEYKMLTYNEAIDQIRARIKTAEKENCESEQVTLKQVKDEIVKDRILVFITAGVLKMTG